MRYDIYICVCVCVCVCLCVCVCVCVSLSAKGLTAASSEIWTKDHNRVGYLYYLFIWSLFDVAGSQAI